MARWREEVLFGGFDCTSTGISHDSMEGTQFGVLEGYEEFCKS